MFRSLIETARSNPLAKPFLAEANCQTKSSDVSGTGMAAAAAGRKFYRFKIQWIKEKRTLNIESLFEKNFIHEFYEQTRGHVKGVWSCQNYSTLSNHSLKNLSDIKDNLYQLPSIKNMYIIISRFSSHPSVIVTFWHFALIFFKRKQAVNLDPANTMPCVVLVEFSAVVSHTQQWSPLIWWSVVSR